MPTETLDITEARNQFNRLDARLSDERVIVVTRHNKRVFAVVDLEYLETLMETVEVISTADSFELFAQALDDIKNGRLHDHEDVKRELM